MLALPVITKLPLSSIFYSHGPRARPLSVRYWYEDDKMITIITWELHEDGPVSPGSLLAFADTIDLILNQ